MFWFASYPSRLALQNMADPGVTAIGAEGTVGAAGPDASMAPDPYGCIVVGNELGQLQGACRA